MDDKKYQPIIGLEVHVELKTKSKMFCSCSASYFGKEPNTHVCPVCLGLPGALPVPNKTAIEWCIKIALALNCKISNVSKFDRKNYFYPDLPKGYQISQYDEPFGINGYIEVKSQDPRTNNQKRIRIRRVHMEEDTGKLLHAEVDGKKISLIDFNRSGLPLVEIVTEPDFENASQVTEYLQKLQRIVRYLGVSNADMEKGEMRLEPNISLRELKTQNSKLQTEDLPKYRVEVKNINSFRFVAKAIDIELKRQQELLEQGKIPIQETRGWDDKRNTTVSQRTKEEAHEYRYFPEPDIPPILFTQNEISNIKNKIPELPDGKRVRFIEAYGITEYDADILVRERKTADYFEQAVRDGKKHNIAPKQIANLIINKKPDLEKTVPAELVEVILLTQQTTKVSSDEIKKAVEQVLLENPKAVEDYKSGKTQVLGFLIGKVKQILPPKSSTSGLQDMIEECLH